MRHTPRQDTSRNIHEEDHESIHTFQGMSDYKRDILLSDARS